MEPETQSEREISADLSGLQPVFDAKSWDVPEILGVVSHQSQIVNHGDRSDHEVHAAEWGSLAKRIPSQAAKLSGAVGVELQHMDLFQQLINESEQAPRIRMFVCSGIKFTQHDRGDRQLIEVLDEPMGQLARTTHMSRADVRVQ